MPFFSEQNFLDELEKLNLEQRLAVDTIDGPVMVIAGPGSGKTQILTLRVANILRLTDVNPGNILCLTFTDAAAKNMQERLARFLGSDAYKVHIHTFHSFCSSIINQYSDRFVDRFGLNSRAIEDYTRLELFKKIIASESITNPLTREVYEQGLFYLKSINKSISVLKKAGIEAEQFDQIIQNLELEIEILKNFLPTIVELTSLSLNKKENKPTFENGVRNLADELSQATQLIQKQTSSNQYISYISDLATILGVKINDLETGETKLSSIKEFLKKYIEKDKNNEYVLKVQTKLKKYKGLASIYYKYMEEMYKKSYFDFDDMILEVNNVFQKDTELKLNLIEKYQYILVDEFQDTNGAQFDLVFQLIDNEFNDDQPNIMVVGDDDQSIYKFQGATTQNIKVFFEKYNPVVISLQKNYRSSHRIVESSRALANKLEEKITSITPLLTKEIEAHNSVPDSEIHKLKFDSNLEEYYFVSKKIKSLIDSGVSPDEIGVLSRKHSQLEALTESLKFFGVPVNYEKGNNVLNNTKIRQLMIMMEFVDSLNSTNQYEKEYLLPEIFAFDCFSISSEEIRNLALEILKKNSQIKESNKDLEYSKKQKYVSWIDYILTFSAEGQNEFRNITQFLFDLSKKAKQEPVEKIIDFLVGVDKILEDEEGHGEYEQLLEEDNVQYHSPYKNQYFDKITRFDEPNNLQFLSNLRFLINKIRSLEDGSFLKLSRVVEILKVYQDSNDLMMIDKSSFISSLNSVNLMTAHRSKGLEFEYVFVIGCNDSSWKPNNRNDDIVPSHLHLEPILEDVNDYLRLFYVAVTRAKTYLFLTFADTSEDGGKSNELAFLADIPDEHFTLQNTLSDPNLKIEALNLAITPEIRSAQIVHSEKQNLFSLLDNYSLSVTHLNNFLDMENGGPKKFLEMNLLRFPQSKDRSAGYGTAVHSALCEAYNVFKKNKVKISTEDLLYKFQLSLVNQKLLKKDYEDMLERGKVNLTEYWLMRDIESKFEVERQFKNIKVGEALLAGNIDKMIFEDSKIIVVDYKTGKPLTEWERFKNGSKDGRYESGDFKDYSFHKHQNQLLFYKLLVENSGSYGGHTVNTGRLEFPNVNDVHRYNFIPTLDLQLQQVELQKLERLIQAVWKRIMNFDFSLTRDYDTSYAGTLEWIKDLLEERAEF
jgi:DNA helicase II / ATP-dependent DNA helicase PcrA